MTQATVTQAQPATPKKPQRKPINHAAAKPRPPAMNDTRNKASQKQAAPRQAARPGVARQTPPVAATPDMLQKLVTKFAK